MTSSLTVVVPAKLPALTSMMLRPGSSGWSKCSFPAVAATHFPLTKTVAWSVTPSRVTEDDETIDPFKGCLTWSCGKPKSFLAPPQPTNSEQAAANDIRQTIVFGILSLAIRAIILYDWSSCMPNKPTLAVSAQRLKLSVGISLIAVFVFPAMVFADTLVFKSSVQDTPEKAWVIRKPDVAFRYLGRLEKKDSADYFSVTLKKDQKLEVSLETPTADGGFRPIMVFFGPGISQPKEDPVIQIGDPNGAIVLREDKETRDSYFDRLTLTSYNLGPSLKFIAPKDATYGLAVRSPKGDTGRYVLRFKGKDDFDWGNVVDFLVDALRAIFRRY